MKTLMVAVAFATVFATLAFAQTENAWKWKGSPYAAPADASAARASARSAYGQAFTGPQRSLVPRLAPRSSPIYYDRRRYNVSPASPLFGNTGW